MYRIKHINTGKYYSSKWVNPTFTNTGKIFTKIENAENLIRKLNSECSWSFDWETILVIEKLK